MHQLLQSEVQDVDVGVAVWVSVLVKSISKADSQVSQFRKVWEQVAGGEYLPIGNQLTADKCVAVEGWVIHHLDVVFRYLVVHYPVSCLRGNRGVGVASELEGVY